MAAINGLTVSAKETAFWWQGARDPAWSWQRLHLEAPQPVHGVEPPAQTAEGARPERLAQVPQATGNGNH